MFASIHAWLIYIRVAQVRAIACELTGQSTEDVLNYIFFAGGVDIKFAFSVSLYFSLSILFIGTSVFKLTVNATPVYCTLYSD